MILPSPDAVPPIVLPVAPFVIRMPSEPLAAAVMPS